MATLSAAAAVRPAFDARATATAAEQHCLPALAARIEAELRKEGIDFSSGRIDETFHLSPHTYLRFLRARALDVDNAFVMMMNCIRWRLKYKPASIDESSSTYMFGRLETVRFGADRKGHPALWVYPRLHDSDAAHLEKYMRHMLYCVELFMRETFLYDGVGCCIVFDMKGFSVSNMDFGFIRFIANTFANFYPETLGNVYVVDAPWVFSPMWKVIRPWLDPRTSEKVLLVSRTELHQHIDLDKVPKMLGGHQDAEYKYVPRTPGLKIAADISEVIVPEGVALLTAK